MADEEVTNGELFRLVTSLRTEMRAYETAAELRYADINERNRVRFHDDIIPEMSKTRVCISRMEEQLKVLNASQAIQREWENRLTRVEKDVESHWKIVAVVSAVIAGLIAGAERLVSFLRGN